MRLIDIYVSAKRSVVASAVIRGGGEPSISVTVPAKPGRKYGENAALFPGLNGRIVAQDASRLILWLDAKRVVRWFERRPQLLSAKHPANADAAVSERSR